MSELKTSLVTWEREGDPTRIPKSDWICPGSLETVERLLAPQEEVNDDMLLHLADGRRQHIQVQLYGGGHPAAEVVDSDSGLVLTDAQSHRACIPVRDTGTNGPFVRLLPSAAPVKPVFIEEGRWIVSVEERAGGTETTIYPSGVPATERDHRARRRNYIKINPAAGKFFASVAGEVGALPDTGASLRLYEGDSHVEAGISLYTEAQKEATSRIDFTLDKEGMPQLADISGRDLLHLIGMRGTELYEAQGGRVSGDQAREVFANTMRALGHEGGQRVDLRKMAAGVSLGMGHRHFDPMTTLAFK
jgi:hypothetical protein